MFDINSLNKIKDGIPENVKEKVSEVVKAEFSDKIAGIKDIAWTKLGLTSPLSGQTPEAAVVPKGTAQGPADEPANLKADEVQQAELKEDKTEAA